MCCEGDILNLSLNLNSSQIIFFTFVQNRSVSTIQSNTNTTNLCTANYYLYQTRKTCLPVFMQNNSFITNQTSYKSNSNQPLPCHPHAANAAFTGGRFFFFVCFYTDMLLRMLGSDVPFRHLHACCNL